LSSLLVDEIRDKHHGGRRRMPTGLVVENLAVTLSTALAESGKTAEYVQGEPSRLCTFSPFPRPGINDDP